MRVAKDSGGGGVVQCGYARCEMLEYSGSLYAGCFRQRRRRRCAVRVGSNGGEHVHLLDVGNGNTQCIQRLLQFLFNMNGAIKLLVGGQTEQGAAPASHPMEECE